MPLYIIKQDITKVECDAIVNAAKRSLLGGGGVDGAIHRVAGRELLEECRTLGGCETGDAKITKGYNLPCKYVIHTVGPVWNGGGYGEKAELESCYRKSLALAKEYGVESIAFPLISSGVYGYPKDKALEVAVQMIKEFLHDNEMTVYIVIFDKDCYQISEDIFGEVQEFIDDNYEGFEEDESEYSDFNERNVKYYDISYSQSIPRKFGSQKSARRVIAKKEVDSDLIDMLANMDDNFAVTLLKLIDLKGVTDVECYKKANVSKQTWYKIMNEKEYRPSKNTVICFAISLKLSLSETKQLLETVGFALSKSSIFDVIIEYFITKGEYDIFTINETLFKFDQVCLGV